MLTHWYISFIVLMTRCLWLILALCCFFQQEFEAFDSQLLKCLIYQAVDLMTVKHALFHSDVLFSVFISLCLSRFASYLFKLQKSSSSQTTQDTSALRYCEFCRPVLILHLLSSFLEMSSYLQASLNWSWTWLSPLCGLSDLTYSIKLIMEGQSWLLAHCLRLQPAIKNIYNSWLLTM